MRQNVRKKWLFFLSVGKKTLHRAVSIELHDCMQLGRAPSRDFFNSDPMLQIQSAGPIMRSSIRDLGLSVNNPFRFLAEN